MKKKYLIIFLSLIIVYLLVNSVINTGNYANFKKKFPEDLKTKIKKYIFPYKYIEQKDDIIKMVLNISYLANSVLYWVAELPPTKTLKRPSSTMNSPSLL